MRWLKTAAIAALFPLSITTTMASANAPTSNSLAKTCNPAVAINSQSADVSECSDYLTGYFDGFIAAEQTRMAELEQAQYSKYKQRALSTRAGGHLQRLNVNSMDLACVADPTARSEKIDTLADRLGYTGDDKVALLDSINTLLRSGSLC